MFTRFLQSRTPFPLSVTLALRARRFYSTTNASPTASFQASEPASPPKSNSTSTIISPETHIQIDPSKTLNWLWATELDPGMPIEHDHKLYYYEEDVRHITGEQGGPITMEHIEKLRILQKTNPGKLRQYMEEEKDINEIEIEIPPEKAEELRRKAKKVRAVIVSVMFTFLPIYGLNYAGILVSLQCGVPVQVFFDTAMSFCNYINMPLGSTPMSAPPTMPYWKQAWLAHTAVTPMRWLVTIAMFPLVHKITTKIAQVKLKEQRRLQEILRPQREKEREKMNREAEQRRLFLKYQESMKSTMRELQPGKAPEQLTSSSSEQKP